MGRTRVIGAIPHEFQGLVVYPSRLVLVVNSPEEEGLVADLNVTCPLSASQIPQK